MFAPRISPRASTLDSIRSLASRPWTSRRRRSPNLTQPSGASSELVVAPSRGACGGLRPGVPSSVRIPASQLDRVLEFDHVRERGQGYVVLYRADKQFGMS